MTYNIHPIFVHFPIALLFVYSIIRILPLKKWLPNFSWKHVEVVLLVAGVAGAFVANSTGEIAEHLVRPPHDLVEIHALFASASTWIYGILLLGEVLYFVTPKINIKLLVVIQNIIQNNIVSKILSLLGLITISITGLLGGVMVYGVGADPLAPIVLNLLGINY